MVALCLVSYFCIILLFSKPSCVPLTRKLLKYKFRGKLIINSNIVLLLIITAKEPPEKFCRKKLAGFFHEITGKILIVLRKLCEYLS